MQLAACLLLAWVPAAQQQGWRSVIDMNAGEAKSASPAAGTTGPHDAAEAKIRVNLIVQGGSCAQMILEPRVFVAELPVVINSPCKLVTAMRGSL